MPDLFFYRDPEEAEKEEKERWVEVFKQTSMHISWEARSPMFFTLESMC